MFNRTRLPRRCTSFCHQLFQLPVYCVHMHAAQTRQEGAAIRNGLRHLRGFLHGKSSAAAIGIHVYLRPSASKLIRHTAAAATVGVLLSRRSQAAFRVSVLAREGFLHFLSLCRICLCSLPGRRERRREIRSSPLSATSLGFFF